MSRQFRITPETAATVVVATLCIYLVFIVFVRVLGPRSLTSMSSFDFGCVVAFGAVLGRTALLDNFNLMNAIVALATLFSVQGVLGVLRRSRRIEWLINRPPVVLVADGALLPSNMRRVHVVEDEIRQAVRRAGLHGLQEVQYAILEANGAVSVIAATDPVQPWLLRDVSGQTPPRATDQHSP